MALPRRDGGHASTEASAVQAADPCLDATALVDGAPAVLSSAAWHALLHGGRDAFSSVEEAEALAGAAPLAWDALLDALALVASACRRCAACADDLFGAGGAAAAPSRQRRPPARGAAALREVVERYGAAAAGRGGDAALRTRTTDARRCCGTSRDCGARRARRSSRPPGWASADGRGHAVLLVVARGGGPSAATAGAAAGPARAPSPSSTAAPGDGGVPRPRRGRGVGRGAAAARARARRRAAAPPRARGDLVRAPPAPAPAGGRHGGGSRRGRASRPGHGEAWDMAAHFYAECLPFLDDDGAARDDDGGVGAATATRAPWLALALRAGKRAARRREPRRGAADAAAPRPPRGPRRRRAARGRRGRRLRRPQVRAALGRLRGPRPRGGAGGARPRRASELDALAGAPRREALALPLDLAAVDFPPGARAAGLFGAAAARRRRQARPAARRCDRACATLERGRGDAPRADAARFALVCDLFLRRLPAPRPPGRGGFWAGPARAQLDLLRSLRRCALHAAAAAAALPPSRRLDGERVLCVAAIAAIADAVARARGRAEPARPSTARARAAVADGAEPFGFLPRDFAADTGRALLCDPDLVVARTALLDYFRRSGSCRRNRVFDWEATAADDAAGDGGGALARLLLGARGAGQAPAGGLFLGLGDAAPRPPRGVAGYAVAAARTYRTTSRAATARSSTTCPSSATSATSSSCSRPAPRRRRRGRAARRRGAAALPRDVERLLCYLTAPYLRLPLVLRFFADAVRVRSLRDARLRATLDAVLFECGAWLPADAADDAVDAIPAPHRRLLRTPCGALFNELVMSPGPTCTAVARLLDLALGLDAGRWAPRGVAELVLFATRVAARALEAGDDRGDGDGDAAAAAAAAAPPPGGGDGDDYGPTSAGARPARRRAEVVDVQLGEFSLRQRRLEALPRDVRDDADAAAAPAAAAAAAATTTARGRVSSAALRRRWRLVGRRVDVVAWAPPPPPGGGDGLAPPPRRAAARLARAGPREAWVGAALAPLLGDRAPLAGFALFLPRSFDAAAGFCAVVGFLDRGGARHWRECHAGRGGERGGAFVEVYEVAEHGRSWWRSLCYTSDAGRSLGAPRHSEDDFEDGGDCGCEAWPLARATRAAAARRRRPSTASSSRSRRPAATLTARASPLFARRAELRGAAARGELVAGPAPRRPGAPRREVLARAPRAAAPPPSVDLAAGRHLPDGAAADAALVEASLGDGLPAGLLVAAPRRPRRSPPRRPTSSRRPSSLPGGAAPGASARPRARTRRPRPRGPSSTSRASRRARRRPGGRAGRAASPPARRGAAAGRVARLALSRLANADGRDDDAASVAAWHGFAAAAGARRRGPRRLARGAGRATRRRSPASSRCSAAARPPRARRGAARRARGGGRRGVRRRRVARARPRGRGPRRAGGGGATSRGAGAYAYDAAALAAEAAMGLTLRGGQAAALAELAGRVERGESSLRQMIMGSGKTTVLTPALVARSPTASACRLRRAAGAPRLHARRSSAGSAPLGPRPVATLDRAAHVHGAGLPRRCATSRGAAARSREPDGRQGALPQVRRGRAPPRRGAPVARDAAGAAAATLRRSTSAVAAFRRGRRAREARAAAALGLDDGAAAAGAAARATTATSERAQLAPRRARALDFTEGDDPPGLRWRVPFLLLDAVVAAAAPGDVAAARVAAVLAARRAATRAATPAATPAAATTTTTTTTSPSTTTRCSTRTATSAEAAARPAARAAAGGGGGDDEGASRLRRRRARPSTRPSPTACGALQARPHATLVSSRGTLRAPAGASRRSGRGPDPTSARGATGRAPAAPRARDEPSGGAERDVRRAGAPADARAAPAPAAPTARRGAGPRCCSDGQAKLLNLYDAWLGHLLPFALGRVDRVHYGLLSAGDVALLLQPPRGAGARYVPKARRLLAVPFVGKDRPSDASEFSHPDVLIGLTILAAGWTPASLPPLRRCIKATTRALVTGLSNREAAAALAGGLGHCDGVLYFDEEDRPASRRGGDDAAAASPVAAERRFTFYDHAHCTGLDVAQAADCRGALTLSKDSTYRDLAQAAFASGASARADARCSPRFAAVSAARRAAPAAPRRRRDRVRGLQEQEAEEEAEEQAQERERAARRGRAEANGAPAAATG
ncbi:hypothetical protein JL722_11503 [Aureococcus anophagefferens]|nr:hypothetical protein JL722_11503 [Aureococcus anophagefferens]